ncbi:MAG TPA: hypothetical protein VKA46_02615 [Gemmataceae bacterium]|nr:hypothetical protein [Gemmataceae bacterium]
MPLAKLTCPKCRSTLKPAKPVPAGKMVKCPKCEEMFKAGGEAAEDEADAAKKPAAAVAKKPAAAAAADDDEDEGTYAVVKDEAEEKRKQAEEERKKRKKRKKKRQEDGEEDEDEDEDEEERDAGDDLADELLRNLKSKDPRGPTQETIVSPANWLLRTALVGFFGWVGYFVVFMIPVAFPQREEDGSVAVAPAAVDKDKKKVKFKLTEEMLTELGRGKATADTITKLTLWKNREFDSYEDFLRRVNDAVTPEEVAKVKKATKKFVTKKDKHQHWWSAETILDEENTPWSVLLFVFVLLLGLAQTGAIAIASVKMQALESYQWSVAGCIVAIIPLVTFPLFVLLTGVLDLFDMAMDAGWEDITWLMALIAFVWGPLVGGLCLKQVLLPHVKTGFEYKPD